MAIYKLNCTEEDRSEVTWGYPEIGYQTAEATEYEVESLSLRYYHRIEYKFEHSGIKYSPHSKEYRYPPYTSYHSFAFSSTNSSPQLKFVPELNNRGIVLVPSN